MVCKDLSNQTPWEALFLPIPVASQWGTSLQSFLPSESIPAKEDMSRVLGAWCTWQTPGHPASAQHLSGKHFTFFFIRNFSIFSLKAKNWCVTLSKFALQLCPARQTIAPENPAGHRASQLAQMWGETCSCDTKYCSPKCQTWSHFNSFGNTRSPSSVICAGFAPWISLEPNIPGAGRGGEGWSEPFVQVGRQPAVEGSWGPGQGTAVTFTTAEKLAAGTSASSAEGTGWLGKQLLWGKQSRSRTNSLFLFNFPFSSSK